MQMATGAKPDLPLVKHAPLRDLLEFMAHPDPQERAGIGYILQHCYTRAGDVTLLSEMVVAIGGLLGDYPLTPEQDSTKSALKKVVNDAVNPLLAPTETIVVSDVIIRAADRCMRYLSACVRSPSILHKSLPTVRTACQESASQWPQIV